MKYGWTEAGYVHVPGKGFIWLEKQHFIKENFLDQYANRGYGRSGGVGAQRHLDETAKVAHDIGHMTGAALSEIPINENLASSQLIYLTKKIEVYFNLLQLFRDRNQAALSIERDDVANQARPPQTQGFDSPLTCKLRELNEMLDTANAEFEHLIHRIQI